MRRAVLAFAVVAGLMLGTAFPVSGLGDTQITLNCDDGTSLTTTVDADGLTAVTNSVQALLDYPAGLTCTLTQVPGVVHFGAVAYAWKKEPWVNGGGHFSRPCPPPNTDPNVRFWTNVAINAHTKDSGTIGTFNLTIPGNQCVDGGHMTSRPQCLFINPSDPPGARAYITSLVTQVSGTFPGVDESGIYVRASFEDNLNPGQQSIKDNLNWTPQFTDPTLCPDSTNTALWPQPNIPLTDGNITVHPGQL